MWDFSTEPGYAEKLAWADRFVREECESLDLLFPQGGDPYDVGNSDSRAIVRTLQQRVREQDLRACHLGPELGGQGYGQV